MLATALNIWCGKFHGNCFVHVKRDESSLIQVHRDFALIHTEPWWKIFRSSNFLLNTQIAEGRNKKWFRFCLMRPESCHLQLRLGFCLLRMPRTQFFFIKLFVLALAMERLKSLWLGEVEVGARKHYDEKRWGFVYESFSRTFSLLFNLCLIFRAPGQSIYSSLHSTRSNFEIMNPSQPHNILTRAVWFEIHPHVVWLRVRPMKDHSTLLGIDLHEKKSHDLGLLSHKFSTKKTGGLPERIKKVVLMKNAEGQPGRGTFLASLRFQYFSIVFRTVSLE